MAKKPVKKTDPRHPNWVPPVGIHKIQVDPVGSFWIFHTRGLLVTGVTFEQREGEHKMLSVTLENGDVIPLNLGWKKGTSKLFLESIIPGDIPISVADSATKDTFPWKKEMVEGSIMWEYLDYGMSRDPERALEARRIAATKDPEHWCAYRVYSSLATSLSQFKNWDEWLSATNEAERKRNKQLCSNPSGTDGWR